MNTITAKIKGIRYTPFLCRKLKVYSLSELDKALSSEATFILKVNEKNHIALSWWVSAKRTRSYPYARVYDSLSFGGRRVTIIPVLKDEGKDGDRDFLQWDTISLMSLLGIYVIVAYYKEAKQSSRYEKKITEQRFNVDYLESQITKLLFYQSDALHWNLSQIDMIGEIGNRALDAYNRISKNLGMDMHSKESAKRRIEELKKGKDTFMRLSRNLAALAQKRESVTIQPKEKLKGVKGMITITNYLGGNYYFTSDEVEFHGNDIYLIDAKHSKEKNLPAIGDIKDGLLKMILFSNLDEVKLDGKRYNPIPVLKLTTGTNPSLNDKQKKLLEFLKKEAIKNKFKVLLNDKFIA